MEFVKCTESEAMAARSWDINPKLRTVGTVLFFQAQYLGTVTDLDGSDYVPMKGSRAAGLIPAGKYWLDLSDSWGHKTFTLRMYGPALTKGEVTFIGDFEPSPADKALDDVAEFERKRLAKRAKFEYGGEGQSTDAEVREMNQKYWEQVAKEKALGNAMSKLPPHAHTIGARLAPYRGPAL